MTGSDIPVKILVIDDESSIRESFSYYLEDREFLVVTAENGRVGMELIEKEKPDLVLSDLRMPEFDGFEILEKCSDILPDMPIIVISGANRIDDAVEALRLGAWDYLVKPVKDLSILEHAVEKVLERARLLRENHAHQEHLEIMVQDRTSELEDAFEALQVSEQKYRTLFEKTNDAVMIIQKKTGLFITANEAAFELTGRSLEELKNLEIRAVAQVDIDERLNRILQGDSVEELGQVKYIRPDGSRRVALVTIVPMDAEAVIVISRDITHNLEIEEQLRQAQKMEAIGTLAGGIAHDFNNILSAILGYSELSLIGMDPEDPLRNKLEAISRSGERARELVAQILAFSRSDKQVVSAVRIDIVLKEALKFLRPAIPSTISIDLKIKTKSNVLGDPTRLHQIMMNLCTNANQAMLETGGTLSILLDKVDISGDEAITLNVPSGTFVKLVVADTGCGIEFEELSRIFEPYYTTKEKGKGTGMGLAVVHGIIKSHGGSVSVQSTVGEGTEFCVFLPVSHEETVEEKVVKKPLPMGEERILIVDDEIDIVEIEQEILQKLGYDAVSTTKPAEALEIFEKDPGNYDLVITDMTMPKLTGIKLAKKLKAIKPAIRVIICSGYNEQISAQNCRDMGVDGYISKPVTMRELAETVRAVLDS